MLQGMVRQAGLQALNGKTAELASKSDNGLEMQNILSRITVRANKLRNIPVEKYEVQRPDNCPFERRDCESCAGGERSKYSYGDAVRKTYIVTKCFRCFTYKKLLERSQLKGIQFNHIFENADIDSHNKSLYSDLQAWDYKSGKGVYIAANKDEGNPQGNGTGKSYALHAMVHKLCREGVSCLYARTVDFLQEIKATYDDESKENEFHVLSKYIHVPVLLWDDLGKESFKKENTWAPEKFYYIVDERVSRKLPIIISSNFDIEDLELRFGEDNHGPAIVSRLFEHCAYYSLGGPDRRIKKMR